MTHKSAFFIPPCHSHLYVSFFIMDFSLLTTSGVSQKRNETMGNKKPPAMWVEDKLLLEKISFPFVQTIL